MAAHLIAAGHEVFLHTRSEVPAELLTGQAGAPASSQEVAQKADIIFLMLPDTPDVAKVLFGDEGVASGLSQGKTVVDMSSISLWKPRNSLKKSTRSAAITSTHPCRAAKSVPKRPT